MCRAVQGGSWEVVEKSTIFIRKIGNKPPKAKLGRGLIKTLKEDRIGCAGLCGGSWEVVEKSTIFIRN